jgi:hypothetical protein
LPFTNGAEWSLPIILLPDFSELDAKAKVLMLLIQTEWECIIRVERAMDNDRTSKCKSVDPDAKNRDFYLIGGGKPET